MMSSALIMATLAIVGLLLIRLLRVGKRPSGLPPGPPTLPVLGNIHLMPDHDLHLQLQKWSQEYGPIYSLILGTKTMIVLSSDEAVRDLLDKRSAIYSDRQEHYVGQKILSNNNRMVMMHYGPTWRMIRKMVHSILNVQQSAAYIPYQDLENKQMLFELLTQPDRFLDSLRRYTLSLTTSFVYGFRTVTFDDPKQAELYHVVDVLTVVVNSIGAALLDAFPVLQLLPDALMPIKKYCRAEHRREWKLFMDLWLNVKQEIKSGTEKPCLSVEMVETQKKEGFTDDIGAYTAGSILEAGADTTSSTLSAWIQAMLLFPEVQKKAQEQVDQVIGDDRLPDMNDYTDLPYVRSCIKEATRWLPTAIIGFPHAVMEDDEYMGYRIPKGAGVIGNIWAIQMDPKRHPDPRKFDPDRYKDDHQSMVDAALNPDISKRGIWAFGAGRRICQGMHVAERSLFLAMARILWAFDIEPVKDDNGNPILPDSLKLTQGFVCMPEPFRVSIKPRSSERAALVRKTWNDALGQLDPDTKQWK